MTAERKSTLSWLSAAVAVVAVMVSYHRCTTTTRELPRHGVITGIIYAEEKPSVAINSKIIHEAETIDGVKVVKIYRDRVKFEENKNKWTQRVQQRPNHTWPNVD